MMKSGGSMVAFVDRPIAAALGAATLLIWLSPLLGLVWQRYIRVPSRA
jgi:putative tricarboxylic transport membrane protein